MEQELFVFKDPPPERDKDMTIYRPGRSSGQDIEMKALKEWEVDAFYLLYDKPRTQISIRQVAEKVGKTREWVSKFYNSEVYKTLAKELNEKRHEALESVAYDVLEEVLKDRRAPAPVRTHIAFRILSAPIDPRKQAGTGAVFNMFNIDKLMGMDLSDISGMKANLIKEIQAALPNGPKAIDGEARAVEDAGARGEDTQVIQ